MVLTSPPASEAEVSPERIERLVLEYGAAKSRQDVDGALALCHDDIFLEVVCVQMGASGRAEAAQQLKLFFQAFPDLEASTEGTAHGPAGSAVWGTTGMTMKGPLLGFPATDQRTRLPFVSVFTFKAGLISGERFHCDLATLCSDLGLPVDEVARIVGSIRTLGR